MKFLLSLLLLLAGIATAADRPNVVFLITDDQGYGDIAAHGHPFIQTPNLDDLHADSVRLDDYHVAPTCAPSRSSIYTGHWTNRTGVWHTIMGRSMIRENEVTIGDMFGEAGYATGFFGKWHLGDNYPFRPGDRGFEEVVRHGGGGVGQTPDFWDNAYFDDTYWHNGEPTKYRGHCTDVFYGEGRRFIREQVAAKKPFLAIISTNAPHGPMHAPQEFADRYADELPGEKKVGDRHYFGMITHIDDNVGQLRAMLDDLGVTENTIFIFTTDNGTVKSGTFDGGMRGGKGSEYDGGHRVPFFLHYPDGELTGGRSVASLTGGVDVVPTLIDLCGVPAPAEVKFDGTSIRHLLENGDEGWEHADRILVTDSQRVKNPEKWRKSAVMQGSWRLVNGEELYDISADPKQQTNLADQQPETLQRLRDFYDAWWAELEPTFVQTTEPYLGHPDENDVVLTSHDWISEGTSPWNQGHIRNAESKPSAYGPWAIKVVEAGEYEITLRRWPREADLAIHADHPASPGVPGQVSWRTRVGKGVPATHCVLNIGGEEHSQEVGAETKAVTFRVNLEAGSDELFGKFLLEGGGEIGTFYAYVRKL